MRNRSGLFVFSSRRRHTRCYRDWSSDVCSSDLIACGLPHIGRGDLALAHKETGLMQSQVAGLRRFGAAALDLAWIAAGRLDGYWERDIKPWDIAAGLILVREAGGFVTGCEGNDDPTASGNVVARHQ